MKRIFLLAIAIALMSLSAASAQRFRVNQFTPFNVRPDVVIRGGHNPNVVVNGFGINSFNRGGTVFVNSFGGFNGNRSTVFVAPSVFTPAFFPPPQVFVAPTSPVFVGPSSINSFGFSSYGTGFGGFSTFSTGGCGRW